MKKINFSIKINSPKEIVWATLWDDITYRQWTAVFSTDSHAVSDWKEGSEIKFIDNKGDGIHSIIRINKPNEQMSIKHLGEIKDGVETTLDWDGAMEEYFLNEKNGITELKVEMDMKEEYEKFLIDTFPKALALIKQISENN